METPDPSLRSEHVTFGGMGVSPMHFEIKEARAGRQCY
jgi:hypothetical protein